MESRLLDIEKRADECDKERDDMRQELIRNTQLTEKIAQDTADLVAIFKGVSTAGKVFIAVAKWITIVGAAITVVYNVLDFFKR